MGSGVSPRWAHGMEPSRFHHFHVTDVSGALVEVPRAEGVVHHAAQAWIEAAHVVSLGLCPCLVLAVDGRGRPRLLAEPSAVDVGTLDHPAFGDDVASHAGTLTTIWRPQPWHLPSGTFDTGKATWPQSVRYSISPLVQWQGV